MALLRLLAIDDDLQLLRALARMLRRTFDVTIATNVADAAARLAIESFDVILCDRRVPPDSGEAFVATLPSSTARLVVFMSGDEAPIGAVASHPRLLKPFTQDELMNAMACRCLVAA